MALELALETKLVDRTKANAEAQMVGRSPFSKLGPANESEVRVAKTESNITLSKAIELWCEIKIRGKHHTNNYRRIAKIVDGFKCDQKQLDLIIITLTQFQNEPDFSLKAGLFISALINEGKGREYSINVTAYDKPLDCLAYRNKKKVVIEGNVGDRLAWGILRGKVTLNGSCREGVAQMARGGRVFVNGNADDVAGIEMNGGFLAIRGNAGDRLGEFNKGGRTRVLGNCGAKVGDNMERGVISVSGFCVSIGKPNGGRINISGKMAWPKAEHETSQARQSQWKYSR